MLRIATYLAPSPIPQAGLGLFCRERVAKGALIWRFDPGLDLVLHALPEDPMHRRFVEIYGYQPLDEPRRWVICMDDARFINHADEPNTWDEADITVASRDMMPGTEITSDYRSFCRDPFSSWGALVLPRSGP